MAGVFSIMSDAAAGMYKLAAPRPWDDDGKSSTLQEKAENGAQAFSLDPEFVRGAQAAKTAMEEAIRIGGPKGAAEDRMAKAEKRLKEIRQEARMAAARGDREKLMQLAREAALLARDAGRAAKDYASGVAAAQMGIGGDPLRTAANGGASGVLAMSSTSIQTTTTTLQVRQVEVSVTLTIKGDGDGDGEGQSGTVVSGELSALTASLSAQSSDQEGGGPAATGAGQRFAPHATHSGDAAEKQENGANGDDLLASLGLPSEINVDGLAERVAQGLSASGQAIGGFNGAEGKALLGAMIHDNELKASRYKEADAFARRVEAALNDAKSVIGEAKAANSGDQDVRRRGGRRKALDEMDKEVHAGFEAAADLRSAAFGSGAGLTMVTADAAAPVAAPVAVAAPAVNITA